MPEQGSQSSLKEILELLEFDPFKTPSNASVIAEVRRRTAKHAARFIANLVRKGITKKGMSDEAQVILYLYACLALDLRITPKTSLSSGSLVGDIVRAFKEFITDPAYIASVRKELGVPEKTSK